VSVEILSYTAVDKHGVILSISQPNTLIWQYAKLYTASYEKKPITISSVLVSNFTIG